MEKEALHFDNNFENYDNIRPGYPKEIYEIISKYKTFDKNSKILEIGAGNGLASREIYSKWHCKLFLIEPGIDFCNFLNKKFGNIKDIKIENTTFEEYPNQIFFDAIFSATAFHWLDLSNKYKKSYEMLKNDGLLILYWNYYGIDDIEMENEMQKIYTKYGIGINDGKNGYERQLETIENRKKEFEENGYFRMLEHKTIKRVKEYTAENNIKLLRTFPDHSKLDEGFFAEIYKKINQNGNKIDVRIMTNLIIGIKK